MKDEKVLINECKKSDNMLYHGSGDGIQSFCNNLMLRKRPLSYGADSTDNAEISDVCSPLILEECKMSKWSKLIRRALFLSQNRDREQKNRFDQNLKKLMTTSTMTSANTSWHRLPHTLYNSDS
ncbi:hypothetical protein X798_05313 [Onchocerca flexuosa]|uniref:Uncharacterized protein n=1 Tax=Onchocerca flexuosa TaxID=387005 RepID=A0A238BQM6_9BILA|nr:hypothetical protein X798_05313 [Onchocerca flexuosa]